MKDAPKDVLNWSTNFLRSSNENVHKNWLKNDHDLKQQCNVNLDKSLIKESGNLINFKGVKQTGFEPVTSPVWLL